MTTAKPNAVRHAFKRLRKKIREVRARVNRRLTNAKVIAVTGSSGKTTTVALLAHILSEKGSVRSQFVANQFRDAVHTLRRLRRRDAFVVLEQGTEAPGQLPKAAELIKPDIAIVTLVAIEHCTAFRTIEAVAEEKASFVRTLPVNGRAILNFDDPHCRAMAEMTRAKCVFFGVEGGEYRATDLNLSSDGTLDFVLHSRHGRMPLRTQLLGKHNWLSVTAAVTCALELGVSADTIAEKVASFSAVHGRMSVYSVNGRKFILDTEKAPYHSIGLPLETLRTIAATKKRFILGQISDYRGNSDRKYRDTYQAAAKVADEVCFVGARAHKAHAPRHDVETGKFRAFASMEALARHLTDTAQEGEVILLKSARNLHLERLMLDAVEPVRCWANECGKKTSCFECGLFGAAFDEHEGRSRSRRR
ncbi:Mur ligase family protein [Hyphomicrobium facile]|uniref:UDP-N-acetylmuramoyl-tripeptide--D-alanyl-D-alanine ligase n=1 Tax=Hyphomicrobium facile TaxID=51670 RepID=A0A1I7NWN8_9HYPH|nr:Mur ligase family protein [Hyphomicrobium facile]SFV39086.1 UDP-N-acetylmuramoyl-tripeptide--D-alanyl-D-alanine ligase [Hyphomicrobium facile]